LFLFHNHVPPAPPPPSCNKKLDVPSNLHCILTLSYFSAFFISYVVIPIYTFNPWWMY
jgi:hypothetical protein